MINLLYYYYYLILIILNTITQSSTYSQNVRTSTKSLHLCCPIDRQSQSIVTHVDCDSEKPGSGDGKEHYKFYWAVPGNLTRANSTEPVFYKLTYKPTRCPDGQMRSEVVQKQVTVFPKNITFLSNSYLQIEQEYFHHNEFCLHKFNNELIQINVCQPNCFQFEGTPKSSKIVQENDHSFLHEPRSTTCIQKCCPGDQSFGLNGSLRCTPTNGQFSPTIYAGHNRPLSKSERIKIDVHILYTRPRDIRLTCPENTGLQMIPFGHEQARKIPNSANLCFQTHQDGKVFYRDPTWTWRPAERYCIDTVQEFKENEFGDGTAETEFIIMTCSRPSRSNEKLEEVKRNQRLYGGVMISSSFFLLLTFIVYLLLWDQKGLHGWTTMGHSSSMFFAYIFLGTAHILTARGGYDLVKSLPCVLVGVFAHFFFLSSFCWLALISFDLWWTFRALNPKVSRSRGARRFIFYVFCGWVTPCIAVIVSLILDSQYGKKDCSTVITPQYGQRSCYIQEEALGEYLYYPAAGLLCLNLIFFCLTIWKLYEYKQTTRIATSNLESKRQFFKLFAKLFFVCGFTWAFEVISWLHVGTDTPWYWIVIDILDLLQAIEVFIIYVCKKDTVFALQRKYPCLKPLLEPFVKMFKCKRSQQDVEQSSRLHSSNSQKLTREKTMTRDSALTTSVRTSSTNETDLQ